MKRSRAVDDLGLLGNSSIASNPSFSFNAVGLVGIPLSRNKILLGQSRCMGTTEANFQLSPTCPDPLTHFNSDIKIDKNDADRYPGREDGFSHAQELRAPGFQLKGKRRRLNEDMTARNYQEKVSD
jgi:hypothetical protein